MNKTKTLGIDWDALFDHEVELTLKDNTILYGILKRRGDNDIGVYLEEEPGTQRTYYTAKDLKRIRTSNMRSHRKYYYYLENLRVSGKTNMYLAADHLLRTYKELDEKSASQILSEWVTNYKDIEKYYGW